MTYCNCVCYDGGNCPTCESVNYHNSIYGGLSKKEKMLLFRERVNKAFEYGGKDGLE